MYDTQELPLDPPDPVFYTTRCKLETCELEFPPSEEFEDGDECPECGHGTLEEVEQDEPCRCTGDDCYC